MGNRSMGHLFGVALCSVIHSTAEVGIFARPGDGGDEFDVGGSACKRARC